MNAWRRVCIACLVLLIGGCAVIQPPEREPEPGPDVDVTEPDAVVEEEPPGAVPAVVALVSDAEAASEAGEHDRAAALLERALRIDAHNPVLWHNLAVVRYREASYDQAEAMAMRSNRYANGRLDLMQRNWELIAVSRELGGDPDGAEEAKRRARELGGTNP